MKRFLILPFLTLPALAERWSGYYVTVPHLGNRTYVENETATPDPKPSDLRDLNNTIDTIGDRQPCASGGRGLGNAHGPCRFPQRIFRPWPEA